MLVDHLIMWSLDIPKQNVRLLLLGGGVNALTCIFMVHRL